MRESPYLAGFSFCDGYMGTTDILESLNTALAAALGVSVIKGFPDWARPAVVPPIAALEITAWTPSTNRIGQRQARQTVTIRVWLFARHEPGLCELLDALTDWSAATPSVEVDSQRVDLILQDGLRYAPETSAQQEQHAFVFSLLANW